MGFVFDGWPVGIIIGRDLLRLGGKGVDVSRYFYDWSILLRTIAMDCLLCKATLLAFFHIADVTCIELLLHCIY